MTKSELIESLVNSQGQLGYRDIELAVKTILEQMVQTLAAGDRIEIRGFGSFSTKVRKERVARNPKNGEKVSVKEKKSINFRFSKEIKRILNED